MLLLKLASAFALFYFCGATTADLDSAVYLLDCSREAIAKGVPEINIPSHTPLHLPSERRIDYNGSNQLLGSFHVVVENITWTHIPDWHVEVNQTSKDSDELAVFPYNIYWKQFVIKADYAFTNAKHSKKGDLTLVMKEVNWNGILKVIKPSTSHLNANFTEVWYTWHVDDVNVKISGSDWLDNIASKPLAELIKNVLNNDVLLPGIKKWVPDLLNYKWAQKPEKVANLLNWCHSRNQ